MSTISAITARQIFDSRGMPTVEVTVELNSGITSTSSAPSGNVSNTLEAQELRDHVTSEYFGFGVHKAVENVNTIIAPALIGKDPLYQTQIDQILVNLDGTTNKSRLGSNAILAVSQAVMKAAASSLKLPLFVYIKEKYQLIQSYRIPTPIFNLINGGSHGSGTLDFQEFQLVPASHLPYSKALQIGVEMFMALDKVLEQKGAIRTVGVEGGYSPNLATNIDALEIFNEAIKLTAYALAKDAFLGLDVAPKNFYRNGKYTIKDRSQPLKGRELVQFYKDLHHQYRVFSFEDPLMPDTWGDWKFMNAEMGDTAMIVADDLITTNKTLLMQAIQENACNAVVIKPNRVGTVTEAIEITHLARQNGWHTILSHRSGETTDDFLADLAVGIGTEYVKFGAPSRGERVVKYNRLLRIEEILLRSKKGNDSTGETTMNTSDSPTSTANAPMTPVQQPAPTPTPATMTPANTAAPVGPAVMPDPVSTQPLEPTPVQTHPAPAVAPMPTPMPTQAPTPTPVPATPAPQVSPMPAIAVQPASAAPMAPTQAPNENPAPAPAMQNTDVLGDMSALKSPVPAAIPTPEVLETADDLQDSINELANMAAVEPTATAAANSPSGLPGATPAAEPTNSNIPQEAASIPSMPVRDMNSAVLTPPTPPQL